jgi:hypothetical protein
MSVIASAFTNGFGASPVVSGAAAANEVLTSSSATAAAWQLGLIRQASTVATGYVLVNGTGTVISWTAPNDGNPHRVVLLASLAVTVTEVGGQITCSYTAPDGTATSHTVYSSGQAATDVIVMGAPFSIIIGANTTFTVTQNAALTSGAAKLFAEIWGS